MCPRSKSTRKNTMPGSLRDSSLQGLVSALAEKQPTPGGGAAAAIAAAIGDAAGAMACAYTQRKKDKESGAAAKALVLRSALCDAAARELVAADEDAEAYAALQTTWTDKTLPAQAKAQIEASALAVPTGVVERCHEKAASIAAFAPSCNPNIVSDAKVVSTSSLAPHALPTRRFWSTPHQMRRRRASDNCFRSSTPSTRVCWAHPPCERPPNCLHASMCAQRCSPPSGSAGSLESCSCEASNRDPI